MLRGQAAARKRKSSMIAVALMDIQQQLEKRSLDLKLSVLGTEHSELAEFMIAISVSWYNQGLYREAEPLEVKIADLSTQKPCGQCTIFG